MARVRDGRGVYVGWPVSVTLVSPRVADLAHVGLDLGHVVWRAYMSAECSACCRMAGNRCS